MVVVLGFNDRDRQIRSVVQDVVGPFRFPPLDGFAFNNDLSGSERNFLANLRLQVPPGPSDRRCDELCADVSLAECLFVDSHRGSFWNSDLRHSDEGLNMSKNGDALLNRLPF